IAVDGLSTDTLSEFNQDGTLKARTVATATGDGLTTSTTFDFNGDGSVDSKRAVTTVKKRQWQLDHHSKRYQPRWLAAQSRRHHHERRRSVEDGADGSHRSWRVRSHHHGC